MALEDPPRKKNPEHAQIMEASREHEHVFKEVEEKAQTLGLTSSSEWQAFDTAHRSVQNALRAYRGATRGGEKRSQKLIDTYFNRLAEFETLHATILTMIENPPKKPANDEIDARRKELEKINLKERRTKGGSMDHDRHEKDALALEDEIRALERTESERKAEESRNEEILEIRKRLNVLNEKERRTKAGSMDHDRHEKQVLELEEELRALERGGQKPQVTPNAVPESKVIPESAGPAPATTEGLDRSAATPLETLDEELKTLNAQFGATETTAAERSNIKERMKVLMAQRDWLLAADGKETVEYEEVGEFTGNQTFLDADAIEKQRDFETVGSVEEEPIEKVEAVEKPKSPAASAGPIVMVNSVLARQAMGAEKRTRKNAEKMKKFGTFPADPRYGGSLSGEAPETVPVAAKLATRAERLANQEKKKKNTRRGLLGVAGAVGLAGLIGWLNPFGKKEETTTVKAPERPAAARSAKDAGLKTPSVKAGETPPPVTVPAQKAEAPKAPVAKVEAPKFGGHINAKAQEAIRKEIEAGNLREADAKMVMEWEHMAYQKAGEALPPDSDKRILSVVETIRANRDNPYAFKPVIARPQRPEAPPVQAAPAAPVEEVPASVPAATAEQTSAVQIFNYGEKGKIVPFFVSADRAAFDMAQTSAESLPEGAIVRFEYVSTDPVTKSSETIYGAFLSLGNGKVSPLLQDPETGGPFTAPDPKKMSRARRSGETATGG